MPHPRPLERRRGYNNYHAITSRRPAAFLDNVSRFLATSWTNRLIAINCGVFLLQQLIPEVTLMGAKVNYRIAYGGEWHRLFTPVFLHGSISHLLVNSYSMNAIGQSTESLFGTTSFLAMYFFSGFTGCLLSYVLDKAPIAVGSSTAISGLLGGLAVFCARHRKIYNFDSYLSGIGQTIAINAVMGLSNPRIDNLGHLGRWWGEVSKLFVFERLKKI